MKSLYRAPSWKLYSRYNALVRPGTPLDRSTRKFLGELRVSGLRCIGLRGLRGLSVKLFTITGHPFLFAPIIEDGIVEYEGERHDSIQGSVWGRVEGVAQLVKNGAGRANRRESGGFVLETRLFGAGELGKSPILLGCVRPPV